MIFHGYFRSSAAWRCRIAFNLKGVQPDETRFVHLRRNGGEQNAEGFRALNPQGLVPALEVSDGVLIQSLAIIEYLDQTMSGPKLLPADPLQQARVKAFAMAIACDIHPLQNLRVLNYLTDELGATQDQRDRWCRHWIGIGLEACEHLVERDTRFCFGDEPGLADICLIPQMASAERFGLSPTGFPRLLEIADRCNAIAAFKDAAPNRQPDAEP